MKPLFVQYSVLSLDSIIFSVSLCLVYNIYHFSVCLSLSSILFRLYWFVTKVIYSSMHVSVVVYPGGPFYLPFNVMLVALYAMQVQVRVYVCTL